MRPALKWLFRDADAVIAYGAHVRRSLVSDGVEPRRIFEAPQAIDNSRFLATVPAEAVAQFRLSVGAGSDDLVILYVGRLVASKGLETLLRSVAKLSGESWSWILVVTGSGPLEPLLLRTAAQLGITNRVHFTGRRPNADLPLVYQASDIVVVPSEPTAEGAEPWGLVVNEAMASGVAVVASDAVGAAAHGLPLNGETGIVFRATDADELARALMTLVTDDELRLRLAVLGRAQVQRFTYQSMIAGILDAVSFARSQHSPSSAPNRDPRSGIGMNERN
jgi:glycosyltransferase involved in cell wall biosynthesis